MMCLLQKKTRDSAVPVISGTIAKLLESAKQEMLQAQTRPQQQQLQADTMQLMQQPPQQLSQPLTHVQCTTEENSNPPLSNETAKLSVESSSVVTDDTSSDTLCAANSDILCATNQLALGDEERSSSALSERTDDAVKGFVEAAESPSVKGLGEEEESVTGLNTEESTSDDEVPGSAIYRGKLTTRYCPPLTNYNLS